MTDTDNVLLAPIRAMAEQAMLDLGAALQRDWGDRPERLRRERARIDRDLARWEVENLSASVATWQARGSEPHVLRHTAELEGALVKLRDARVAKRTVVRCCPPRDG